MSRRREKEEIQRKINENQKRAHLLGLKSKYHRLGEEHHRLGEEIKKIEESQKDDDGIVAIIGCIFLIVCTLYTCSK